jgi:hypothetical protein
MMALSPFLSEYIVVRKSYLDWINIAKIHILTKTNVNCHFYTDTKKLSLGKIKDSGVKQVK